MQNYSQVIFEQTPAKQGHIGLITLNRPEALNALSGEMMYAIYHKLQEWAIDPNINLVILQGAGGRAFCSGGDLKQLYNFGPAGYADGMHFYEAEYKLNLFINHFPKPIIAILNGITMGGGMGISMNCTRVIATEKLQLAMPETGIGFFPDVGAGYFFRRCPEHIGMYLGLTGNIVSTSGAIYAKLVHAYIPSEKLDIVFNELTIQNLKSNVLATVDALIGQHSEKPGFSNLQQHANTIQECFGEPSVEEIIVALKQNGSAWALEQVATLKARSPTSLKVAFKLFALEATMSLEEALKLEYKIAVNIMQQHDVYEGIRAAIIDKTHDPKWQPATLDQVKDADIEAIFK